LPMFLQGLMFGSPDIREQAAKGLGELITLTTSTALKPFVLTITGPLIRIIGDRFVWQVKSAILQTLSILLDKGGILLKPFLPQLQTTFVKALHDSSALVRADAATALGKLMTLNAKVDPLVGELVIAINSSSGGVQEGMIKALYQVLLKSGKDVTEKAFSNMLSSLLDLLESDEGGRDDIRRAASKCIGVYAQYVSDDAVANLLQKQLLTSQPSWIARHGQGLALTAVLRRSSRNKFAGLQNLVLAQILSYLDDAKVPIRQSGLEAAGFLLRHDIQVASQLVPQFAKLLNDNTNEVKLTCLNVTKIFAKTCPQAILSSYAVHLVVPLIERVKDRSVPIKLAAERTLLHLLQIKSNSTTLQQVSQQLDPNVARTLVDYCKRVLSKLADESDEEVEE